MPSRTSSLMFVLLSSAMLLCAQDGPSQFRYNPAHTGVSTEGSVLPGGLAWRFETHGKVRSTPAISKGLVVFGSEDGHLYAADLKTGAQVWAFKTGCDVSSSPAIVKDRVVFMARDGVLRCLELKNGKPVWNLSTGPEPKVEGDPRLFDTWVGSPVIDGDALYVGSGDGKVYAVDVSTGKQRWAYPTGGRVRSTPAVAGGIVYVGSFDGFMYAFDAATGALKWKGQTGAIVQSSPTVVGDRVFVANRGAVLALDAKTGHLLWMRPHPGSWVLGSTAVVGNKVIVGSSDGHFVHALDAGTGKEIWHLPTQCRVLSSPVVAGSIVLFGGEDFRVYGADLESGLCLSMEFTEAAIYGSVVPVNGLLLAGCEDNCLYAFRTHPAVAIQDTVSQDVLKACLGDYGTDYGDVYSFSIQKGRLAMGLCTFPLALVELKADGSFFCPMFGMKGKLKLEPGKPCSEMMIDGEGGPTVAKRLK